MITIYGTKGCGFCKMAAAKCAKMKLKYEYKDISIRKWYLELKSLIDYDHNIPKIFIDGEFVGDYKDFVEHIQEKNEKK